MAADVQNLTESSEYFLHANQVSQALKATESNQMIHYRRQRILMMSSYRQESSLIYFELL